MGVELAQSNAAWMLERGYGHAGPHAAVVAMSLHRRSAEQGNVQSLLNLGDGYYYGTGVAQDWVGGRGLSAAGPGCGQGFGGSVKAADFGLPSGLGLGLRRPQLSCIRAGAKGVALGPPLQPALTSA
jgi:TPR repeat protein